MPRGQATQYEFRRRCAHALIGILWEHGGTMTQEALHEEAKKEMPSKSIQDGLNHPIGNKYIWDIPGEDTEDGLPRWTLAP